VEPPKTRAEKEPPEEKPVVTHHKITAGGKTLAYTATTGRMPIKNEQEHTEAEMFYVAYTLDNGGGKRPLTFAFNGGPGSATIWLHMGCFGPKRVKMLPNGFMPSPPFEWEDNPNTLLDRSDLVFVDAIGTGYSRALSAELGKKFWSLSGDIAAFGEFIRLYLQKNSRWTSPIYLAGESYGTTRAAGLSGYLVDHGVALNGITLISTILQFQTASFVTGNDLPYILYLPTYAMIAAYHHKLAPELEKDPEALRKEVSNGLPPITRWLCRKAMQFRLRSGKRCWITCRATPGSTSSTSTDATCG
jgi:carboxypeptidase C (cathepsin A)